MKLTKTSNLVLLTILIGVSVTSAYAITITLGADPVNILGDLNVDGTINIFGLLPNDQDRICFDEVLAPKCLRWRDGSDDFLFDTSLFVGGGLIAEGTVTASSVTAEDYTFTNPHIRKFVIGSNEFNADAPISYSGNSGEGAFFTSGTNPTLFGAIHIPAGSTITQLDCRVIDNHATRNVNCDLLSYLNGLSAGFEAGSVSTGQNSLVQIISTGTISVTTLSTRNYYVTFNPTNVDCDSDCRLFQAIITYEVSTAD